MEEAELLKVEL